MLETIKILLGISGTDKDSLLSALIAQAQSFVVSYCNLPSYDTKLDSIINSIVIEDFNKLGSEGIQSKGYSGLTESYLEDYSPSIYKQLNRHKKIKML